MKRAERKIPSALIDEWKNFSKIEAAHKKRLKRTLYREVIPEEAREFPGRIMSIDENINMTRQFNLS